MPLASTLKLLRHVVAQGYLKSMGFWERDWLFVINTGKSRGPIYIIMRKEGFQMGSCAHYLSSM